MKKKTCHVVLLCTLFASLQVFASPEFKGFAGFLGNLTVAPNGYYKFDTEEDSFSEQIKKTFDNPILSAQGYFGGQVQFQDSLILRVEFSVFAKDIFGKSILESPFLKKNTRTNSLFQIQEASAVYKLQTNSLTHFLSAFYGEYEPIGSDVFLQRQFGIAPIHSDLTYTFNSLNGISINERYGGGISYIARSNNVQRPLAAGIYLFRDWNGYRGATNADFRIGGAFDYVTFDLRTGFSLPDKADEDESNSIDYVTFNAGFSMLGGKQTSIFNVLLQAGFSDLVLDPLHKTSNETIYKNWAAESFYFLFEPRVNLRKAKFSVTAFNIPYSQASKMFFLNNYNGGRKDPQGKDSRNFVNPCGIDLHASTNSLRLGDNELTTGLHVTISMGGQTVQDMYYDRENENPWKKTVFVSPYAKLPLRGGEVYAATTISSHIFNKEDNWPSCVSVKVGFKINF